MEKYSFVYERLPKTHIRLLSPISHDRQAVTIKLTTYAHSEAPAYDAVSYAWGDDKTTATITCNECRLPIRANLFKALKYLHEARPGEKRPLWIDAICLNQDDKLEKANHVPLMGKIYESAKRTLVWLGEPTLNSDQAMEQIADVVEAMLKLRDEKFKYGHEVRDQLPKHGLPSHNSPFWPATTALLERSWIQRLWTFQEIILAQDPIILCGSKSIRWDELASLTTLIVSLGLITLVTLHRDSETAEMWPGDLVNGVQGIRTRLRSVKSRMNLPILIEFSKNRLYTESIDRLWAIMGLLNDQTCRMLEVAGLVNYHEAATAWYHETYLGVMKAHVAHYPAVAMVLLASGISQAKNSNLPSWCPDWHLRELCLPIAHIANAAAGRPDGRSNLASPVDPLRSIMSLEEPNILNVLGISLGTITNVTHGVGRFWTSYSDSDGGFDTIRLAESSAWMVESFDMVDDTNESCVRGLYRFDPAKPPRLPGDVAGVLKLVQTFNGCVKIFNNLLFSQMNHGTNDLSSLVLWCNNRKFFHTIEGEFGLGPPDLQIGDVICAFFGGAPLFVLRPIETEWSRTSESQSHSHSRTNTPFRTIGDAYVPDLMHGEGFQKRSCEDMTMFKLI